MTDAPERVTVKYQSESHGFEAFSVGYTDFFPSTEYVRADLHAALAVRVKELEGALRITRDRLYKRPGRPRSPHSQQLGGRR